jgi:hypothetical protein
MPTFALFGQFGNNKVQQIGFADKFGSSFKSALGMGVIKGDGSIGYQIIGNYQEATFISPADYVSVQDQINNVRYKTSSTADVISPTIGSYKDIEVIYIPNRAATLNLRFSDLTPIRVSSCRMYLHEGGSGILYSFFNPNPFYNTQWYECVHTSTDETLPGSGASTWSLIPAGATGSIVLRTSPGPTGSNPVGSAAYATRHDWYLCLSVTPAKSFPQSSINISCMIDYV